MVNCAQPLASIPNCNDGGLLDIGLAVAQGYQGLPSEIDMPYTCGGSCHNLSCSKIPSIIHMGNIEAEALNSEQDILNRLALGTVTIGLDAGQWQDYGNGSDAPVIRKEDTGWCPIGRRANHAVQIVGWVPQSASEPEHWIIRNSWGTGWGGGGYIRIEAGQQVCGIGRSQSYFVDIPPSTLPPTSMYECDDETKGCIECNVPSPTCINQHPYQCAQSCYVLEKSDDDNFQQLIMIAIVVGVILALGFVFTQFFAKSTGGKQRIVAPTQTINYLIHR